MRRKLTHSVGIALFAALVAACHRHVDAAMQSKHDAGYAAAPVDTQWRELGANSPRMQTQKNTVARDGAVTTWHDAGAKESEGELHNGQRQGAWSFWYADGGLRWQGTFEAGIAVGAERAWYPNSQQHYEGTLIDGKRNGSYRFWYDNGTPEREAEFVDDQLHGKCRHWDVDGQLDARETGLYERGRKVAEL